MPATRRATRFRRDPSSSLRRPLKMFAGGWLGNEYIGASLQADFRHPLQALQGLQKTSFRAFQRVQDAPSFFRICSTVRPRISGCAPSPMLVFQAAGPRKRPDFGHFCVFWWFSCWGSFLGRWVDVRMKWSLFYRRVATLFRLLLYTLGHALRVVPILGSIRRSIDDDACRFLHRRSTRS